MNIISCKVVVALAVCVLLGLPACGRNKDPSARGKGKAAAPGAGAKSGEMKPGAAGMKSGKQPVKIPTINRAPLGSRAGSAALLAPWNPEALILFRQGQKALQDKQAKRAATLLTQALAKQPGRPALHWQRALARATVGAFPGAFEDLAKALYGDFPSFGPRVATNALLESLRAPPHQNKLKALLGSARREHIAAIKGAELFLGSFSRLRRMKITDHYVDPPDRAFPGSPRRNHYVSGDQGLYGFNLKTGRYLSVVQVPKGAVVGFIRSPDRRVLVFAAATEAGYDEEGDHAFLTYLQLDARALDLTQLKQISRRGGYESPGNKYYGGRDCSLHMDQSLAVTLHRSGVWSLRFISHKCAPSVLEVETKRRRYAERYIPGKPAQTASLPDAKDGVLETFTARVCGDRPGLPSGTKIKAKESKPLALGAQRVAPPCSGKARLWRIPENKGLVFLPGKKCLKDGTPVTGLWHWTQAKKTWTRLSESTAAHRIRWLPRGRMMVQVGRRVLYLDPAQGKHIMLAAPVAYLQSNVPYLGRCGIKRVMR